MLFHIFAEEASLKSFKFFIQKAFLILPAVQLLSRSSPTLDPDPRTQMNA